WATASCSCAIRCSSISLLQGKGYAGTISPSVAAARPPRHMHTLATVLGGLWVAECRAHGGHDLCRNRLHIMGHARMRCSVLQNLLLCSSLHNKVTIHANISTPKYFRHVLLASFMVCAVT